MSFRFQKIQTYICLWRVKCSRRLSILESEANGDKISTLNEMFGLLLLYLDNNFKFELNILFLKKLVQIVIVVKRVCKILFSATVELPNSKQLY